MTASFISTNNTPSLAESWTASKDGLTYEFLLRNGIKFHNGDPVTAEDVKFSFERYRGGGAKLFKERVKEVRVVDARRVRFVMKDLSLIPAFPYSAPVEDLRLKK